MPQGEEGNLLALCPVALSRSSTSTSRDNFEKAPSRCQVQRRHALWRLPEFFPCRKQEAARGPDVDPKSLTE